MPHTFTLLFLVALAASTATGLWLALRQMRHVSAHRDEVPADFAGVISPDAHRTAADYTLGRTRLRMAHILLDAALLLALTLGGGLDALARASAGWSNAWLAAMAPVVGVALIAAAVELPLNVYRVFGLEARFGFNRMTVAMFLADLAKQAVVAAALGLPLLALVLWLMDAMGPLWWLWVWAAWMAFNLLVLAIFPTWIAPLFNKFTPLPEGDLRGRVERLLERCGFRAEGLFVMDGSRRSSHGNAYFTGFGRAKRIVFFDTLIARLAPDEIEAVLAHELGHFSRRHVLKRLVLSFAVSLAFLATLGWLKEEPWFYEALGLTVQGTPVALVLFFLVAPVFTFAFQPIAAAYSRRHEFEADDYAARHANAESLISALTKLYRDNASTLTPDPLHSAFYDSHPPAGTRIAHLRAVS